SEHGDTLVADGFNQFWRNEAAFEMNVCAEDGWDPHAHGLTEHVAERQRVQETQRVHDFFIAEIALGGSFDGTDAGQHVAVGVNDALGIAGGAGREEDLQRGIGAEDCDGRAVRDGQRAGPFLECDAGNACWKLTDEQRVADGEFGLRVVEDARCEVDASVGVKGNDEHAAENAAVICREPFSTVLAPQNNTIAGTDAALLEERGEAKRLIGEVAISGRSSPYAIVRYEGVR